MVSERNEREQMINAILDFSRFDYHLGEVVSVFDLADLGIICGEVLLDSRGYVTPSFTEEERALLDLTDLGWRVSGTHQYLLLDNLNNAQDSVESEKNSFRSTASYEGIHCPRCGSTHLSYNGYQKRRKHPDDVKKAYLCMICGKKFSVGFLRDWRMRHPVNLVSYAIRQALLGKGYGTVAKEVQRKFNVHVTRRTIRLWKLDKKKVAAALSPMWKSDESIQRSDTLKPIN